MRRCNGIRREVGFVWAVRVGFLCALAAGVGFSASIGWAGSDLVEQHIVQANKKYRSGDFSGAIGDYSAVIKLDPGNTLAYISRALSKSRIGDFDGAIVDYGAAIRIDPNSQIAYNNRGLLRLNKGDNDGAIADCTKALGVYARSFASYYTRANARLNKGDYHGAIADLTAAIRINRRPAEPYYQRATAKVMIGDHESAIADFTESIRGNANYAPAYNNRGLARFETGDHDGAIGDFSRAIGVDPNYAGAYNNRGIAKHRKARYEEAIADFEEALRINPKHASAYANRADVKKDRGDYTGAAADFTQAISLKPGDTLSYRRRGHLYYDAGRWVDALKDLGMAIQLRRDVRLEDYDVLRIWLLSARLGERDKATAMLERHLKNDSSGKSGDWYRSICGFVLGRLSEEALLKAADNADVQKADEQKCEGYFYAGSVKIVVGDLQGGLVLLQQCLATGVREFTEYASAMAEIESILFGAHFEAVGAEQRRLVVLDRGVGLSVRNVRRGGPADMAGVKEEDILAAVNGVPATLERLQQLCENAKPNERVKLRILRSGQDKEIMLTFGGRK